MKYLLFVLLILCPAVVRAECQTVETNGVVEVKCDELQGQITATTPTDPSNPSSLGVVDSVSIDSHSVEYIKNPGKFVINFTVTNLGTSGHISFALKQFNSDGFETAKVDLNQPLNLQDPQQTFFKTNETKSFSLEINQPYDALGQQEQPWALEASLSRPSIAPPAADPLGTVVVESFDIIPLEKHPKIYSAKITARNTGRFGPITFILKKNGAAQNHVITFFNKEEQKTITTMFNSFESKFDSSIWTVEALKN